MKNIYKLFIAFTALLAGTSAFAEEGNVPTKMDSLILQKVAKPNADGTYTLTLDTYVLGDYTENTTTVKTTKPVDFVLCLDVSGSMNEDFSIATHDGKNTPLVGEEYLDKSLGSKEGYYEASVEDNIVHVTVTREVKYNGKEWQYHNNTLGWRTIKDSPYEIRIYKKGDKITKLEALQRACSNFLDKVEQNQIEASFEENTGHKVGIVTFSSRGNTVKGLTSINSKDDILAAINNLRASGATRSDEGIKKSSEMFSAGISSDRAKVLVLFTDGTPTSGNSFETSVANAAIKEAYALKQEKNVTIFCINTYVTEKGNRMWKYMNYVSSNYPHAESLDKSGGEQESDKYYHLCTNEDALNAAFETIAEESTSKEGGAAIQINTNETVIRDIITPSFTIPAEAGSIMNSIKVYEVPVDTTYKPASHKIEDIRFKEVTEDQKTTPEGVSVLPTLPTVTADGAKGNYSLDVRGFDFSSKWVGFRHASKDGKPAVWTVNPGSKLVIEITIKPDPDAEGGEVKTNEPNSGIYIDGTLTKDPDKAYPVPDPVYLPKNLVIKTTPLAEGKGESLLFKISDGKGFSMIVSMTEGEGEIKDGKWCKIVAKLPVKDEEGNDITYMVIPDRNWSWAYGYDAIGKEQVLLENNVFEFTPSSETTTKKHAENSANNVFAK